jgi:hypothetical protein
MELRMSTSLSNDELNTKLSHEKECLEFEREKFNKQLALDKSLRIWSLLSTFVPLLIVILGYYLNLFADRDKKYQELKISQHTEQIRFVDKQLAEFFYPVKMRLERDNAVWEVSARNRRDEGLNLKLSKDIEANLLMPNHEEIMDLIKTKFHLLANPTETIELAPLIAAMNRYQRHVTIYKALYQSKDKRFPASVCSGCEYPKEFEVLINKHIKNLEDQRSKLLRTKP